MSHADSSTDAILAQLATMQATLDAQQATIAQQQADIAALRQENARWRQAPTTTGAQAAPGDEAPEGLAEPAEQSGGDAAQPHAGLTSRRGLLRGAAAATAVATVGAVALGAAQPAHAAPLADGSNLVLGTVNSAASQTTIEDSAANSEFLFLVYNNATNSAQNVAIFGLGASAASGIGGQSGTGYGVWGYTSNNGVGVYGQDPGSSTGVKGSSANGIGVFGYTPSGWGIAGESNIGYDFVANGTGIIGVQVSGSVGAPTSGNFTIGDCIRDANGDLWLCTATGNPGAWVMALHVLPGMTGGAINYLSKPIRLLDTRSGSPYAAGSTHTVTVAGANSGGVQVPASCTGAIGNLTVLGVTGNQGYAALVPSGVGFTGTANLAFNAGQVVSNAYNVGLSGAGQLDIILGPSASANVILDLFAIVS